MTHIVAGNMAPGFSLQSIDVKEYSLHDLLPRGPVVAAFFKISCPVCQFTLPFLERLYKRYGIDGVDRYIVSNAYGLTNVPTIFLIDTDGTVKVSSMGFDKKDLETIAVELAQRRKIALAPLFRPDEVVPINKPG